MQLTQVMVFTADVSRLASFYVERMGLRRLDGDDGFVRLEGPGGAVLALHAIPGAAGGPAEDRTAYPTKLCFSVPDLDAARERLVAAGVPFGPVRRFDGVAISDGADPDGNVIQLTTRTSAPAPAAAARPPFLVSTRDVPESTHIYPQSDEPMGPTRRVGRAAGLQRIGINVQRLPPGTRSSWPHAEEDEEEFVYVLDGEVGCWVDGVVHPMVAGDLAAFPVGTGISHTFINDGDRDCILLVGGEAGKPDSRILYPLHPSRRADLPWSQWWDDAPVRALGPHDGLPSQRRGH